MPTFTPLQGQYLAFIHQYTVVNGRPPAHADIQRFFSSDPASVNSMVKRLEAAGLLAREPGVARSLRVLVEPSGLPTLTA